MESLPLNFERLLARLKQVIQSIRDPRQASHGTRYRLEDIILSAFSVFFMQCESFLEHQRQMHSRFGQDNAQTLFGIVNLPSDPQLRNVLDKVNERALSPMFAWVYQTLHQSGFLQSYEVLDHQLLVTLDGTQYFSSHQIHCDQCHHQTHVNGSVSYSHQAILPAIVSPGKSEVLVLAPEFITPQDGQEKQDCEINAAKRWIATHGDLFMGQAITLLGDDLYSHQPMCEAVLAQQQMNFIFTCLRASHPALYEWLDTLDRMGEVQTFEVHHRQLRTDELYQYRYAHQLPIRDEEPTLYVNWCELTEIRVSDGQVLYRNAWVTKHSLDEKTVPEIAAAGRCRWKTENENHNVLKTKGYHVEHNFGHGKKHLSKTLLSLNLLAFLFHTVLQWVDESYQKIRKQRGTRRGFFQDILTLTKYLLFDSWSALLDFMLADKKSLKATNSS
jgi:hypothetical protein